MEIDIDPVAEKAVQFFGHSNQLAKSMEELGELISAIAKVVNGGSTADVIDEIADVQIMIRQLRIIYGKNLVDQQIDFKLNRLMKRMDL